MNQHGGSPPTPLLFYHLFAEASFPVSAEAVVFLQNLFSLSSIAIICSRCSLHCGSHCNLMRYKSSFENFQVYVHLIRIVHFAVLRHMLLGILVQPCSHVGSKPWYQSSSCPYLFHFHRNVQNLAHCRKRSKSSRQSNFCNCSLVGASCLLFSFT